MAKNFDPFDDFHDDDEDGLHSEFEDAPDLNELLRENYQENRRKIRARDAINELPPIPKMSEKDIEDRERYRQDFSLAHQEVFTESTGIKPFGPGQLASIGRTLHVLKHGGKSIICEPRGFGKSSRTANNALLGVLYGFVNYVLILASSVEKANDILEAIASELINNDELYRIFPATCESFRHGGESHHRAYKQTYKGEKTHLQVGKQIIRFPAIEDEPSSGSIIQVRSKDNVRGLAVKVKKGPNKGKVLRPDFVFMDDIQTDEEAESPTSVYKIVQTIKKSVMFAGSHARRISAVMCCTPICPGDVPSHFILEESAWDCLVTPMMRQMPTNLNKWTEDYANILLDFDKFETGSRTKAQLEARKFVEDNFDELHEGAQPSWEWAYGWGEDPQTEITATQHAMNFMIEEGLESFNSECQCVVKPKIEEAVGIKATVEETINKTHRHKQKHCPVETEFITTHIDVNKEILTYVTLASPRNFQPMIIDYGTFPEQPGMTWSKGSLMNPLSKYYPDVPEEHERIYLATLALNNKLAGTEYLREDNVIMQHTQIATDMGWKIDEVQRALRDSPHKSILMCARGQGIRAKDKPFMDRHYDKYATKHFHCATVPSRDGTLRVLYMDVNYFKTLIHKGIKTRSGLGGSFSCFDTGRASDRMLLAKHFDAEVAADDYSEKDDRRTIIWGNPDKQDNEFFDNAVGACALLFKYGAEIHRTIEPTDIQTFDIGDFVDEQENQDEDTDSF